MNPLIKPPAFLEALKNATPIAPETNFKLIEAAAGNPNKKSYTLVWVLLGIGLIAAGVSGYSYLKDNKKNK